MQQSYLSILNLKTNKTTSVENSNSNRNPAATAAAAASGGGGGLLLMKHNANAHKSLIENLIMQPSQQVQVQQPPPPSPFNTTMHAMEYILNGFNVLRKIKSKSQI